MGHGPNWYRPPVAEPAFDPLADSSDAASVECGSFQIRVAARVVDAVVIVVCGMVGVFFSTLIFSLIRARPPIHEDHGQVRLLLAMTWFSVWIAYHVIAESIGGASVGKWICDLRVVGERLQKCSPPAVLVRTLAMIVDGFLFGLIARSFMSSSARKQRLGDRLASTMVVVARTMRNPSAPAFGCSVACVAAVAVDLLGMLFVFW